MDINKTLDVMYYISKKLGEPITDVKLMKLMYFSDKKALIDTGYPITDDYYYLMNRGPILSCSLDHLNNYSEEFASVFKKPKSSTEGGYPVKNVKLKSTAKRKLEYLAEIEVEILDDILDELGSMSTNEIVKYAHSDETCPEWDFQHGSSTPLSIKRILVKNGINKEEATQIVSDIEYHRQLG